MTKYRKIPLILSGRIYGQRTNTMGLYSEGYIFKMLIGLHIWGCIFGGAYIQGTY